MTKYVFAATVFFAASSWACPNLTGTYACPDSGQPLQITTLDKYVQNGITVMQQAQKGTVTEMRTDKSPIIEIQKNGTKIVRQYECSEDEFAVHENILNPKLGDIDMTRIYALTPENDLLMVVIGTVKNGSSIFPIQTYYVCERVSDEGIPENYSAIQSRPAVKAP